MNSLPALHYANSPRCNERDRIDNMSGFLSTYISPQSSDNMVINAGSISIIIVMLSLSPHLLLINNVQSGDLVLFITFPQTLQSPSTPVHPLYLNPCPPHEMLWIVAETKKKKGEGGSGDWGETGDLIDLCINTPWQHIFIVKSSQVSQLHTSIPYKSDTTSQGVKMQYKVSTRQHAMVD